MLLEVKLRKNRPRFLEDAMSQAKACAKPGQIPVVVVGAKNQNVKRAFVVVELEDFAEWFGGTGGEAA